MSLAKTVWSFSVCLTSGFTRFSKLRTLKQWNREFENRVDPLVKQTEKLHIVLANDMTKAIAYLTEAIKTLAAYSEIGPRPASSIAEPRLGQTAAQPAEPGEKKVP